MKTRAHYILLLLLCCLLHLLCYCVYVNISIYQPSLIIVTMTTVEILLLLHTTTPLPVLSSLVHHPPGQVHDYNIYIIVVYKW